MTLSASPRKDPKSGTWSFVVDLSPGPNGERRQARRRGFATKKEAQQALDELRVTGRQGAYVAPQRERVAVFLLEDWLPAQRAQVSPSTWFSYDRNLRLHVIPAIGGLPLQSLEPTHLNKLYADLLASGRRDDKDGGLKPRTVRYIATIIGAALDDACRWGLLVRNVARLADPPSETEAKAPEMKTWDRETLNRFLELESADRYGPAWLFLATTGCRRGEALGLRWSDVDLERGTCSIRQTITAVGHRIEIRSRTKTGRTRQITLDAQTIAVLRAWRARQATERLAMGSGYGDLGLVFAHPDGRPYHPDRFSREFDRRVERFGLPRIRLHDLRHTWATLALEAGIDVKVVAERLGNSVTVCSVTYQHVTPAMATDAAERVAGLIFRGR